MVNCMYTCTMTCIVVLLLRSLMLSKNAFTYSTVKYIIQVAALAPLALLLVLEARCAHIVIAHFNNIVCCRVVHHCSHTT